MMTLHETSATTGAVFCADQWLTRYAELGGGYSIVGDAIWLHWLISGNVDEVAIKTHERILRGRPDWRDAVKALIAERVAQEVIDG